MQEGFVNLGGPYAAVDAPSLQDWKSEDVFGSSVKATPPNRAVLDKTVTQDQSASTETAMACTIFAMAHCANEGNATEAMREDIPLCELPFDLAENLVAGAVSAGWFNPAVGAKLQDAMKHFVSPLGRISGFASCKSFDQVVDAIGLRRNPVFTGTNRADWASIAKTGDFKYAPNSYGHAVMIEGYELAFDKDGVRTPDSDFLVARNSYGASWGTISGRFRIFRKDFASLYTCYEIFDKADAEKVAAYRKRISDLRRAYAKSAGIWNGERGNEPVTRGEAAEMAVKASAQHVANFEAYLRDNK